jgi:CheY-like chemotaxis protein
LSDTPQAPEQKSNLKEQIAVMATDFAKYVGTRNVLIADPAPTSRAGIAKMLVAMGAKTHQLFLTSTFEAALEEVARVKPSVIISDFTLGTKCGLDLIAPFQKNHESLRELLFVIVTGTTSQSAVAQAAEEDVDAFLLKPYTAESFRMNLLKAVHTKVKPSGYMLEIEKGKDLMFKGNLAQAKTVFHDAKKLDSKPTLACFYEGQSEVLEKLLDEGATHFSEGLNFNKIHYKCMTGLFEVFLAKKSFGDAYEIVNRISRYFPANPGRLNQVLRLAIVTKNYDDVERYYQVFTSIDQRTDELIKHMCAALVVCGKYYLKNNLPTRALEVFNKAAITAAGRPKILREIVLPLIDVDRLKEAREALKRFPPELQATADYLTLDFLIRNKTEPREVMVEYGRKLISTGTEDSLLFQAMIKRLLEVGHQEQAMELVIKGKKLWPEQAKLLESLIPPDPPPTTA